MAKQIPTLSVAMHMYGKLLQAVLRQTESPVGSSTELKMLSAIHGAIIPSDSYDALATAILTSLAHPGSPDTVPSDFTAVHRNLVLKKIRSVIQALATNKSSSFDGHKLLDALMSLDVDVDSWSVRDEEDKARIMFQCVALSVSPFADEAKSQDLSQADETALVKLLGASRKQFLHWCCTEYGPHFRATEHQRVDGGISEPNYDSALGRSSHQRKISSWMETMRCLLFVEDPSSATMKKFLFPGGMSAEDETEWEHEQRRMQLCCRYGSMVSDDVIWIVLRSASLSHGIDSDMAVIILEELFENCSRSRHGKLEVRDPNIVWELYNLVLFTPAKFILRTVDNVSVSVNGVSSKDLPR
jgi:hypothetical protein